MAVGNPVEIEVSIGESPIIYIYINSVFSIAMFDYRRGCLNTDAGNCSRVFFPLCPMIFDMPSDFSASNFTATGSAVPAPSATEMVEAGCESQVAVAEGFHSPGGTPIAGCFIGENHVKKDDLGVPFQEASGRSMMDRFMARCPVMGVPQNCLQNKNGRILDVWGSAI